MKKSTVEKSLKAVIIGCALCGLAIYIYGFPAAGKQIISKYPEFADRFFPWLFFLQATGIPCFCVLVYAWKIVASMKSGSVFTHKNASRLRAVSYLALFDALFLFLGNIVLFFFSMNHPTVFIISLGISFVGLAIFVACEGLALFTNQAADLQEQSDLTI